MSALRALLPAAALLLAGPARADGAFHGHVAAGGFLDAIREEVGAWATVGVQPPGRWGGRVDLFTQPIEDADGDDVWSGLVEGSVTYQLGAARPTLVVALRVGGGASFPDPHPVLAFGLSTQLGLWGPIAVGFDNAVHVRLDPEPDVRLLGTAGLMVAF